MKIALPCKVSKTAVDPLSSSVPRRRSEPTVLPAKVLRAPSPHSQATAKNGASPAALTANPQESELLSATPRYKPQWEPRLVQPRIVRRLTS
jgi:hypothetical protein